MKYPTGKPYRRHIKPIARVKHKNKYHAKKLKIDGNSFDSKAEAGYYMKLKYDHAEFKVHEQFEIVPKTRLAGKTHREAIYTPDFTIYKDGKLIEAIDVKGYKITADASLRMRAFIAKYQIPVYIVKSHAGGFEKKLF
ncbi:DUF1064 domain-containing protein [Apilactobacillus xinyiensis]|uniref:DUF1064 domain-containing protein n=1 Tax=Apilactobacillus xinyiensis TaxID=2841032 RepID=UPI00200FF9A5|nr:DUF1064 domain-containing protein [Apilactobacillus xinyiensis]MCL0330651.1 DUF1064 domain-containing protein [Apilactobacillus xinyiensis]